MFRTVVFLFVLTCFKYYVLGKADNRIFYMNFGLAMIFEITIDNPGCS